MIYFLRDEHNRIKIGYARKPISRQLGCQTGNADILEIIGVMEGSHSKELDLHCLFAESHIRGEWFEGSQDLYEYIAEATASSFSNSKKTRKRVFKKPTTARQEELNRLMEMNEHSPKWDDWCLEWWKLELARDGFHVKDGVITNEVFVDAQDTPRGMISPEEPNDAQT